MFDIVCYNFEHCLSAGKVLLIIYYIFPLFGYLLYTSIQKRFILSNNKQSCSVVPFYMIKYASSGATCPSQYSYHELLTAAHGNCYKKITL